MTGLFSQLPHRGVQQRRTLQKSRFVDHHHALLPLQDASVMLPVGEARSAHHHVLHQAEVGHLVLAASVVEQDRGLHLVGLYAAHIVGLLKDKVIL